MNWQVLVYVGGTSYSDSGLPANTAYYYRISASNVKGHSTPTPPR